MIGTVLGNYKITGQIGSGGMGIVYVAEHVLLGKLAAIKVLKPERCETEEIIERFFNEARAASMVKDPGIPEIFDYGHLEGGNAYLVMEMLEGRTLGALLKECIRLSPGRALALARLMAGTLKATHAQGIIHRDLKPDNVYVVPDAAMPRGERIKILDFGIAKLQGNTLASGVQTETGRLMGTPYYMSPEQCRGAGGIDHRTDIYSLGCVLYQMLSGRPPFTMQGSGEVLAAHIHVAPTPLAEVEPSIPHELSTLTMRLLEKDPDKRPQTMQGVMDGLNNIASYTEMHTPEPSLAASADMAIEMYRDTIDDIEPLKHSTTLQASSGEYQSVSPKETWAISQHKPSALRRVVMPLVVLLGVGFGGWGAYTVLDKKTSDDNAATQGAAQPVTPIAEPRKPEPAQPIIVRELVEMPAEKVSLTITSDPTDARIYRISDGVEVGRTPLTLSVRKGRGTMGFLLRKSGFRSASVDLPVGKDGDAKVSLKSRSRSKSEAKTKELPIEDTKGPKDEAEPGSAAEFGGDNVPPPGPATVPTGVPTANDGLTKASDPEVTE